MLKKNINLITPKESDPYIIRRLKVTLPIIATISLLVFIGLFMLSVIYVNNNVGAYNNLKNQVAAAELQVEKQKTKEGIYTLTSSLLEVIKQLLAGKKDHYPIYSNIASLSGEGITFSTISIDGKGIVTFTVNIDRYDKIAGFINELKQLEINSKILSQIRADSVSRDKKGIWVLSFSMVLQERK